jgi:hypothetical protein
LTPEIDNSITYLDKRVFQSFFDVKEKNRIIGLSLDCDDCLNHWLIENIYKEQLLGIVCSNGKPITQIKQCF